MGRERFGVSCRGPWSRRGHLRLPTMAVLALALAAVTLAAASPASANPELVRDIDPGATGSGPGAFAAIAGTLFFVADDGTHGFELWRSDGTTAGTAMVKDINPGGDSTPSELVNVNGTLFFRADDGA